MGFQVTIYGRENMQPISDLSGHQQWEKELRKAEHHGCACKATLI